MPRARRDGPLPRVVLCAALTLDGKLDPQKLDPARPPWAAWRDDPATVILAETAMAGDEGWDQVLRRMRREGGARRVVCFGGAELFRALLDAGAVSELQVTVRPRVDGRRDAPTLSGPPGAEFFPASVACRLLKMEIREDECFLRYRVGEKRKAERGRRNAEGTTNPMPRPGEQSKAF